MASGKVLGLAIGPEGGEALSREAVATANFVEGMGLEGDKKFGRSSGRQVNLLSKHSYEWFERNFGRELSLPGGFGENVVIDAIDPNWLDLGQRIQVGEAILQVTTPRSPCAGFTEHVDGHKVSHFVGHVGVMCAVVQGGTVRVGDVAALLDE
ncbi:MAG: MOSC domain-containing protein [Planctomycetes bacterium]|nr:MOSC domain-containing protein [Planctomycetota bacterium]